MRWRALFPIAAAVGFAPLAAAHACDLYVQYTFHQMQRGVGFGAGLQFQPGTPSGVIVSGDLPIGLGNRAVVKPALGYCRIGADGPGGQSSSHAVFGSALGLRLWNNAAGTVAINGQTGVSYVSYGQSESDLTVPVFLAAEFKASERAAVFAGAGAQVSRFSFDGDSESDADPLAFGGVTLTLQKVALVGSIGLKKGETDTDVAVNFGLRIPVRRP